MEFRDRKKDLASEQASGLEPQLLLPIPAETLPAAQVPLPEYTAQSPTPVPVALTEEPLAEEQCEDDWLIDFDDEHRSSSFCHNISCGKSATAVTGGLKRCSRYQTAEYCSKVCQARHWNIHGCKLIALELAN